MADSRNATFEMSKVPVPTEYIKFSMQNLVARRSGGYQAGVIGSGGFGNLTASNWAIFDGIAPDAKLVARGKGSHIRGGPSAVDDTSSVTMVFENEAFMGSTLEVMGLLFGQYGWAIVGGTGKFSLATGSIKVNNTGEGIDNWNLQITIEVFCPVFSGSGVIPIPVKSERFGGDGGKEFDITEPPQSLLSLTIRSGDVIDSLAFTYIDQAGKQKTVGPFGGDGGLSKTIVLAPNETVTKFFGTTDNFGGHIVVTSLNVVTSLGQNVIFGKKKGTNFNLPGDSNNSVVGFFGRGGLFLDAIGVYEVPSNAV